LRNTGSPASVAEAAPTVDPLSKGPGTPPWPWRQRRGFPLGARSSVPTAFGYVFGSTAQRKLGPSGGLEAMSAAFDYPLTAKARLSRSSRLGTHTRSIQAHFRAAQSSPPRPLWFCIADMHSRRSSKRLSQDTRPIGFEAALLQRQPASLRRVLDGGKKNLIGTFPHTDLRTLPNHRLRH
jgi:hypothetical protein